jgi:hypothetical protein
MNATVLLETIGGGKPGDASSVTSIVTWVRSSATAPGPTTSSSLNTDSAEIWPMAARRPAARSSERPISSSPSRSNCRRAASMKASSSAEHSWIAPVRTPCASGSGRCDLLARSAPMSGRGRSVSCGRCRSPGRHRPPEPRSKGACRSCGPGPRRRRRAMGYHARGPPRLVSGVGPRVCEMGTAQHARKGRAPPSLWNAP